MLQSKSFLAKDKRCLLHNSLSIDVPLLRKLHVPSGGQPGVSVSWQEGGQGDHQEASRDEQYVRHDIFSSPIVNFE